MSRRKRHTWVFELTVDETWVEDGLQVRWNVENFNRG